MTKFNSLNKGLVLLAVLLMVMVAGTRNSFAATLTEDLDANGYDILDVGDIISTGPWVDARAYASINAAITDIGSNEKTLLISSNQTLTGNLIIPANVSVRFLQNGQITPGNYDLTVGGSLHAPLKKIFNCNGTGEVTLRSTSMVAAHPEWWEQNTFPGTTDMTDALKAALLAANVVQLTGSTYKFTENLTVPSGSTLRGVGWTTLLKPSSAVTTAITQQGVIEDFSLDGTNTSGATGVFVGHATNTHIMGLTSRISIAGFKGTGARGLLFGNVVAWTLNSVFIDDCEYGIWIESDGSLPTISTFRGCEIRESVKVGIRIKTGRSLLFTGCCIENNKEEGVYIEHDNEYSDVDPVEIRFWDCWFENNWDDHESQNTKFSFRVDADIAPGIRVELRSVYFNSASARERAIWITDADDYLIDNCYVYNRTGQILLDGTSTGIVANWISASGNINNTVTDTAGGMKTYAMNGETFRVSSGDTISLVSDDTSATKKVVANNASVSFSIMPAGFVVARDFSSGSLGMFMVGVSTAKLISTIPNGGVSFSDVSGNSGTINASMSGATISFENKSGSPADIGIISFGI